MGASGQMSEADVEAVFIAAGEARSLVWLTEPSGRYRIVEPYMVFCSSTGKRLFHLYQVGGYSAGGVLRGWKNVEVHVFSEARRVEQRFMARPEYNPFNEEIFPRVVFAVPISGTGRVRAAESGPC